MPDPATPAGLPAMTELEKEYQRAIFPLLEEEDKSLRKVALISSQIRQLKKEYETNLSESEGTLGNELKYLGNLQNQIAQTRQFFEQKKSAQEKEVTSA